MNEQQIRTIVREEIKLALQFNPLFSLASKNNGPTEFSDKFVFQKEIQIQDGRNIQGGKGTGTKIGTEATQKFSFYGVTPIVQQGAISSPVTPGATYAQADSASLKTAIDAIRAVLTNFGITL